MEKLTYFNVMQTFTQEYYSIVFTVFFLFVLWLNKIFNPLRVYTFIHTYNKHTFNSEINQQQYALSSEDCMNEDSRSSIHKTRLHFSCILWGRGENTSRLLSLLCDDMVRRTHTDHWIKQSGDVSITSSPPEFRCCIQEPCILLLSGVPFMFTWTMLWLL